MIYLHMDTIIKMKVLLFIAMLALPLIANEKIRAQLNWKPQFEFAAFYMAKELGFYKEAGLDVELRHLDPEHPVDIIAEIEHERVDIGVSYPSVIPLAIKSKKYMLLTYLFQNSSLIALSKKAPKSLDKSCLYLSKNEYDGPIDLMMRKLGVKCRKPYSFKAFLADPNGVLTSTQFKNEKEREGIYKFEPISYGYDMYDDILFAKKEYYQKHKTALRKFALATLKGWRFALRRLDKAATIIHEKYTPDLSVEKLKQQAKAIRAYSVLSLEKLGLFNPQRIRRICGIYKENGTLVYDADIYDFIDPLFIDSLPLDFKQRELIANTRILYSETSWPPFTMLDQEHKMHGLIEDYIELVRKRTGLDMRFVYQKSWSDVLRKIKEGELDMAMATGETQERKKYAVFSQPYKIYDFAIASKRKIYTLT